MKISDLKPGVVIVRPLRGIGYHLKLTIEDRNGKLIGVTELGNEYAIEELDLSGFEVLEK